MNTRGRAWDPGFIVFSGIFPLSGLPPSYSSRIQSKCNLGASSEGGLVYRLYGADQRRNRVDAVNQGLVEPRLGKIYSIFFFQKYDKLDGIDGAQPAAEKKRSSVVERLSVVPDSEQVFHEFANFSDLIHATLRNLD
jgi:hypothetical protein